MERVKGLLGEPFDTNVEITENGVRYLVDVKDGQKTLDFSWIRNITGWLCKNSAGMRACWTASPTQGSFALNAGLAGAREVLGVDASELGVHQAVLECGAERPSGSGTFSMRRCL